eukprot:2202452-Pleurochrysis_carterae.AAC.2
MTLWDSVFCTVSKFRKQSARISPVICGSDGQIAHNLKGTCSDNGHGDHLERRSARLGSSQSISTCGGGSQGDSPTTRKPRCSSQLARASCERTPRVGASGDSQGG